MGALDPNMTAVLIFIAGVVLARWERGGDKHTKSVQVDTELRQRVMTLEEKVREQTGHATTVTRLEALVQNMARDLHELRSWMLGAQTPYHLRRPEPQRSPYDFKAPREWIDPEQPT